jgi:hypothetical protein
VLGLTLGVAVADGVGVDVAVGVGVADPVGAWVALHVVTPSESWVQLTVPVNVQPVRISDVTATKETNNRFMTSFRDSSQTAAAVLAPVPPPALLPPQTATVQPGKHPGTAQ